MSSENEIKDGKIHTIHVVDKSIPGAYWKAIKDVYGAYGLRTQYDRKDREGNFIDPPGRDAKVMIEVEDPFTQPRFPPISWCEWGKYIAEFLGAKDHLVVSYKKLLNMVKAGEEFEATQWPYCYHQRLTAYPTSDGKTIDQLEIILDKLVRDPLTRRAVAITGIPEIDLFLKGDQPCLREIQLRAPPDEKGRLVLNLHARWRSRDLYKAWGDNLIGITNLQERLAKRLEEKSGKEVIIGPYTEENGSLHLYGQDYIGKGLDSFFENFPTKKSFIKRSKTSDVKKDEQIIPELKDLKEEEVWKFPPEAIELIDQLIEDFETGKFIP